MMGLLRRWLPRACGCLGAGLLLAGLAVQVSADSPPGIRRVVFRGVEEMSPSALREVMHLRQPPWWNPFSFSKPIYHGTDHLEPDLARILAHYRDEGFIFARIEGALVSYHSEDWVEIEIDVYEGMRIYVRSVALRGVQSPIKEQLEEKIEIRPGNPLREPKLRRDEDAIKRICQDIGYALAEVSRETRFRGDSAAVFYQVELGPLVRVGKIGIEGFKRTKEYVIRREVKIEEGDRFRLSRVAKTQDRLFDLGTFRTAQIIPFYGDTAHSDTAIVLRREREVQVDLKVVVGEKPPGWFGLGLGYTTDERGILQAEWGYRNLLGRAWGLQVIGEVSYRSLFKRNYRELDDRRLEMIFTMPWLVKLPVRCQVRPYYRFNHEQDFDEDVIGISLRNRYRLSRGREGLVEVEFKTTATDSLDVPGGAQGRVSTHLLSLAMNEDRRDSPVDPRRGHFAQAMIELA
ncbi:MAG: BamA/TamA family outer membrane protein, partial [Candidatus Eisenbacteria sp.]|nr:BamA/TamA family outer membrane protein [Candidatus Eisenbacteria bacterium]